MASSVPREQAEAFVGLLHSLLRELTAGSNDPAVELPVAQLRVCHVLRAGARSISAIGRELGVSASAVTQIADRLERAELVRRVAEKGDRRVRCLQLTEQGGRLLRLHDEDRVLRTAAMLEQLTPKLRKEAAAAIEILGRAAAEARRVNGNGGGNGGDCPDIYARKSGTASSVNSNGAPNAPHYPKSKVLQ